MGHQYDIMALRDTILTSWIPMGHQYDDIMEPYEIIIHSICSALRTQAKTITPLAAKYDQNEDSGFSSTECSNEPADGLLYPPDFVKIRSQLEAQVFITMKHLNREIREARNERREEIVKARENANRQRHREDDRVQGAAVVRQPKMNYVIPILTDGYMRAIGRAVQDEGGNLDNQYVQFVHDLCTIVVYLDMNGYRYSSRLKTLRHLLSELRQCSSTGKIADAPVGGYVLSQFKRFFIMLLCTGQQFEPSVGVSGRDDRVSDWLSAARSGTTDPLRRLSGKQRPPSAIQQGGTRRSACNGLTRIRPPSRPRSRPVVRHLAAFGTQPPQRVRCAGGTLSQSKTQSSRLDTPTDGSNHRKTHPLSTAAAAVAIGRSVVRARPARRNRPHSAQFRPVPRQMAPEWHLVAVVTAAFVAAASGQTAAGACQSDKLASYTVVMHTFWTRDKFPKHYPDWRPTAQFSKIIVPVFFLQWISILYRVKRRSENQRWEGANKGRYVLRAFTSPIIKSMHFLKALISLPARRTRPRKQMESILPNIQTLHHQHRQG
ncbi:unnamed protein product, partial [Nesidiocoris tenuis]